VHGTQLTVGGDRTDKDKDKLIKSYNTLLAKVKGLVRFVKKSSVANEQKRSCQGVCH